MAKKGGRRTIYTDDLGEDIVRLVASGTPRKDLPGRIGISARTLAYWLARGRAGDRAYAWFAEAFDAGLKRKRELGRWRRLAMNKARGKERWQKFWASRESWWLKKLGPGEFWSRRLTWYASHGMTAEYNRTVADLQRQGYCISQTP